jgi:hypothetical protein
MTTNIKAPFESKVEDVEVKKPSVAESKSEAPAPAPTL